MSDSEPKIDLKELKKWSKGRIFTKKQRYYIEHWDELEKLDPKLRDKTIDDIRVAIDRSIKEMCTYLETGIMQEVLSDEEWDELTELGKVMEKWVDVLEKKYNPNQD